MSSPIPETLHCPITGAGQWHSLCVQDGVEWVRFAASGYARMRHMPGKEDAGAIQDARFAASYIAGYRKKWEKKKRRSEKRARYLARFMTGTRLLDVGSNVGLFVAAARELGLAAEGLEINPDLADFARRTFPDARFHTSALEDFTGARYDAIYCSEVIEHVPDPLAFARRLHSLLEPGAPLYLTTPCLSEYMRAARVVRHLGAPDHKLYFSRSNIAPFLTRAGFAGTRRRRTPGGGIKMLAFA